MKVTIIADASHCPQTKAAGYGYWIASNRGKKGGGGAMKGLVSTSTLAEMQAVANAVHIGIKSELILKGDEILIQTDCEAAIYAFEKKRTVSADEKKVIEWLFNVLSMFELKMQLRHVKGHSYQTDARFTANKSCDRRAIKAMRKARNLLKIKQIRESFNVDH